MKKPKKIVITGAESTGKSTLTESLAKYYSVPYIREIARTYIENLDRKYTFEDIENIAKKQIKQFRTLENTNNEYFFVDTWLINTKVWLEVIYNKVPSWLINEIKELKIDLFLVCENDLPWIPDPVRENGGYKREILKNEYIRNIENFGYKWELVKGQDLERITNAITIINNN